MSNDDNKRPRVPGSRVWHHVAIALLGIAAALVTGGIVLGSLPCFIWAGALFIAYIIGESTFD